MGVRAHKTHPHIDEHQVDSKGNAVKESIEWIL